LPRAGPRPGRAAPQAVCRPARPLKARSRLARATRRGGRPGGAGALGLRGIRALPGPARLPPRAAPCAHPRRPMRPRPRSPDHAHPDRQRAHPYPLGHAHRGHGAPAESTLAGLVAERARGLAFYSEDRGRAAPDGATHVLVVDPIDGTRPAMAGLESACVAVALAPLGDGQPTMADVCAGSVVEI